ncbi:MAG TPA: efflux transporter outer membrane subunit [Steroidobacteraceae bacterium]|nr:efflux transporter outer membrane subunit [Steroidobacteraceae bacterium]
MSGHARRNGMRSAAAAFATATAMALAGCTVGPNFHRPGAPAASAYRAAGESRPVGNAAAAAQRRAPAAGPYAQQIVLGAATVAQWWTLFDSPELDELMRRALTDNLDLAAAKATLAQAQDLVAAQTGRFLPQVSFQASSGRQKYGKQFFGKLVPSVPPFTYEAFGANVSYTLDYDGAIARSVEEQKALEQYQRSELNAAQLTLTGDVASEVVIIATTRGEIRAAAQLLAEDRDNLRLVQTAFDNGSVSKLDVLTAQSQLASDQTLLPPLYQQLAMARHALAVLLGRSPAEWSRPDLELAQLRLPRKLPVSVPSQLVRRRPDILAAEAQLHAATAAVGVATADLYPQIPLTATLAQEALEPAQLFNASATAWSLIAGLTQPLFDGGTLRAQRRATLDALHASAARYQQVVLDAFGQVADLLDALDHDAQLVAAQANARDTSEASLELSRQSYQEGNSGLLQVLDAQRERQRAELGFLRAQARQYLDTIQLLLAVGGPLKSK